MKSNAYWSPFDIQVMLHHYGSLEDFPSASAPIYPERRDHLVACGLLRWDDGEQRYAATELGAAFVGMLLGTPVPITRYIDPRFEECAA